MLYKNKKSDKLYIYIKDVIDCTNSRDGEKSILYCGKGDDGSVMYFVRNADEFFEKFDFVSDFDEDFIKEYQKNRWWL